MHWGADGSELLFRGQSGSVVAAELDLTVDPPDVSEARELFPLEAGNSNWDVTSDGRRFLVGIPIDLDQDAPIEVIMNWEAMLE